MSNFKLVFVLTILLVFSGCSNDNSIGIVKQHSASGGANYGGVFHLNEVENFNSLAPHKIIDITSVNIASQVYEGLLCHDPSTLELKPCLAESWEVSKDGYIYTFHIRDGVYFHDDNCFKNGKGRKLSVNDVIYSLTELFSPSNQNSLYTLAIDKVFGADEHYEKLKERKKAGNVKGIRKVDDRTINIVLTEPYSKFPEIVASAAFWIYPKEAVTFYGSEFRTHPVGTGPFKMSKMVEGEIVILGRNSNYWRVDYFGNQLPYLDALKFTFVKEKKTEINEFLKGNLDMVYEVPRDEINAFHLDVSKNEGEYIEDDFIVQISPALSIQYYSFNFESKIFDNINVRKAFNYAINRKKIVDYALNGMGIPAVHGIIPPAFKDYAIDEVHGYHFNVAKAQEYFAKAGYSGGKGFPHLTLYLNSGGGTSNLLVAEAVQKMLSDNLGIYLDLSVTDRVVHFENAETGKYNFWKDVWLADYYDPENFLSLFYGKSVPTYSDEPSFPNSTRYKNRSFDTLFEKAIKETDPEKQMRMFVQADQKMIDDAPIIPLYYDKTLRLLQLYVRNLPVNPMEVRDFSIVYFDYNQSKKMALLN